VTHRSCPTVSYALRIAKSRHSAAVMRLACRRCNVIFAMITRGEFFRELPIRTLQEVPAA
ncbi:MAG: hypothetical protein L0L18_01755, partial [Acidipropionibacterium jensenii]|nr:hypothetical protein [Acidipropionibacterium jensenii]